MERPRWPEWTIAAIIVLLGIAGSLAIWGESAWESFQADGADVEVSDRPVSGVRRTDL